MIWRHCWRHCQKKLSDTLVEEAAGPSKKELTTVEATNCLNVSRPFVIKEIEAGRLEHRLVASHRRIEFEALQAYALRVREAQQAAIERMSDNARELGLDDT